MVNLIIAQWCVFYVESYLGFHMRLGQIGASTSWVIALVLIELARNGISLLLSLLLLSLLLLLLYCFNIHPLELSKLLEARSQELSNVAINCYKSTTTKT